MAELAMQIELLEELGGMSKDPLAFVKFAFPWGTGDLIEHEGPEPWQIKLLSDVRDGLMDYASAIQFARSSGHGIGKSAVVAWLILWAISTFEDTRGVVTANTQTQLTTKTWAELSKWHRLFIARDFFTLTATSIFSSEAKHEKTWRIDAVPWSKTNLNTEAFAGLHNKGKRIILIFDEASAIHDKIWEVSEGALTDEQTEIMWFAFGNPTRATGRFHACFHRLRHRWNTGQIDSRTVAITDKAQIKKWEDDYGVDSDFFKVRVLGQFPNISERQFIGTDLVTNARGKHLKDHVYNFAPVIIGVDPAWTGSDETAIVKRQGLAASVLMILRKNDDDFQLAGYIAKFEDEHKADAVFIDQGYGTGVYSAGKQMNRKWQLVSFASASNNPGYLNKRAEMWGDMKEWLKAGGAIPDDQVLCDDLVGPEYEVKLKGTIQLESKDDMKKRGVPSPNRADALGLTFAYPVVKKERGIAGRPEFSKRDYSPLE